MRKKPNLSVTVLSFLALFFAPALASTWPSLGFGLYGLEETLSFKVQDSTKPGTYTLSMASEDRKGTASIKESSGLKLVSGFKGEPELRLVDAEYQATDKTEFLFHYNNPAELYAGNMNGRYRIGAHHAGEIQKLSRFGGGALLLEGSSKGIELEPLEGSLFEPDTFWTDFTFEFWLYTGVGGEGEEIFNWEGYTRQGGKDMPQYFTVYLSDKKLNWEFKNVFISLDPEKGGLQSRVVKLSSSRSLHARTWQHHLLRYDSRRAMLEYLVDGKTESIVYATASKRQESQGYQAYTGERSGQFVRIGRRLNGMLDEMRLTRGWVDKPQLDDHYVQPGWFIMNPINFRDIGVGSKVLSFDCSYRTPGTSDLVFYYKMTDAPGMLSPDDPAWIPFKPGVPITSNNQGQFLFIKVEFFPDGAGTSSPSFQGLTVRYKPDPPPPPPGGLVAIPGNGSITLRWNPVPGTDIRGYLIYYGTKPDEFFGEEAVVAGVKKPSPVDAGDVRELTLEGLKNGTIYYFRVATYDLSNDPLYGMHVQRSFSKEVSARPAR